VSKKLQDSILDALWPPEQSRNVGVFAVLDGARDERIFGKVDATYLRSDCLYSGDLPGELQVTAPYLVQLEREDRFVRELLTDGWGASWGTFLRTETGIKQLRKHLRQFLRVRDQAGRRLIFRYYDPRVLRIYLPTCSHSELDTFFGPVTSFVMEGESPEEMLEFRNEGGLVQRKIALLSPS
jgi:hypothetical protein